MNGQESRSRSSSMSACSSVSPRQRNSLPLIRPELMSGEIDWVLLFLV
jgi:hypothetical protein